MTRVQDVAVGSLDSYRLFSPVCEVSKLKTTNIVLRTKFSQVLIYSKVWIFGEEFSSEKKMKELILYWVFWTGTLTSDEIQLDTLHESCCNFESFKMQELLNLEGFIFQTIRFWAYKPIFIILFVYSKFMRSFVGSIHSQFPPRWKLSFVTNIVFMKIERFLEIFGNYQIAYRQINDQGMNFNLIHFVIVQFKTFWTIKKPQITAFDRVQPHKCQYGHE